MLSSSSRLKNLIGGGRNNDIVGVESERVLWSGLVLARLRFLSLAVTSYWYQVILSHKDIVGRPAYTPLHSSTPQKKSPKLREEKDALGGSNFRGGRRGVRL